MSENSPPHFKRVLGLGQTVGIAIGTTIGGGVFTYTSIATRFTGPALPLAYALAAVPVAMALAPVAMLGAALPTVGGNYVYPSRLVSPGVAFMGVWCYILGAFFGFFPLYALTCTDYLSTYFPALQGVAEGGGATPAQLFVAALVLTGFYAVNYVGVTMTAVIEAVLVVVLLLALLMYLVLGFSVVETARFDHFMSQGWGGLLTGGSLLTFAYMGSNAIIELGGEIKQPGRTIPRTFMIAIPIILLVYVSVGVVTVGAQDWRVVSGLAVDPPLPPQPLTVVASGFLGTGQLAFFVIGGALVAIATTINASFLWGTRSLVVLCDDHLFPPWLGRIHPRYGSPARLLTAAWALSLLGLLLPIPRAVLATYATIGGLAIFIPVQIASMLLPRRCPDAYGASPFKLKGLALYLCPSTGILLCVGAMADLFMTQNSSWPLLIFLAWMLGGAGWYLRARAVRPEVRELSERGFFLG